MNYYEEFGLSEKASPEEIKEAYRALMRLLHPDHQSERHMQQVAESQVKKLNHIYKVLSDPDRRRQYDRDLSEGPERAHPIIIHAPPPPQRSFWNAGSLAWVSAVAVFAGLLVWMASRPSPSVSTYNRETAETPRGEGAARGVEPGGEPLPQPPVGKPQPPPVQPAASPAITAAERKASADADALRLRLVQAMNERDAAQAELARVQSRSDREKAKERLAATSQRVNELRRAAAPATPPAPVEAKQEARPEPAPAKTSPQPVVVAKAMPPPPDIPLRSAMAGSWFYQKPVSPPKNKSLYPPEFIETVITEENGQVRGTYHARYRAPDRPVSPEVSFQFSGRINGDSGIFPWNGAGGARGEVTLKLTADHSLKVDWTASQMGTLAFYRGTAVLVRRD